MRENFMSLPLALCWDRIEVHNLLLNYVPIVWRRYFVALKWLDETISKVLSTLIL